jgi:zinc/manganese transport system permease protein
MTSLWHYAFVQQAVLAGVIAAVLAGCVGVIVTARNMSFAVHGLAEVGFTGATGAVAIGLPPAVGVLAATFGAALAIGVLGVRLRERDVAIGSVLAFGLGLGVLFLSLSPRYATEAYGILFGSILAVSQQDVVRQAAVGAVALSALAAVSRPLRFASIDPEVAEARGVPVRLLSTVFLLILALAVAETVQVVGVLLILTLLIVPAAAAQRLTAHPGRAVASSVLIALASTVGGLACAVYTSWPVSFFVSGLSFAAYLLARLYGRRRPATS